VLIIAGFRTRNKEIGMGRFLCPNCRGMQTYRRKRLARYFTLYFVPLFPMGTLGEIVQCQGCLREWKPEVLRPNPSLHDDQVVKGVRRLLAQGISIQEVRTMLGHRGMDGASIEELISLAAPEKQSICTRCHRVYSSTLRACLECGGEMATVGTSDAAKPMAPASLRVDYNPVVGQGSALDDSTVVPNGGPQDAYRGPGPPGHPASRPVEGGSGIRAK
jgi:hypothetical protein